MNISEIIGKALIITLIFTAYIGLLLLCVGCWVAGNIMFGIIMTFILLFAIAFGILYSLEV